MLAKVFVRSRLAQEVEKSDGPNGLFAARLARCGIDPALSRCKSAALLFKPATPLNPIASVGVEDPGLNGLVEGVGRDVLEIRPAAGVLSKFKPGAGEKPSRDGRVPARVLPRM